MEIVKGPEGRQNVAPAVRPGFAAIKRNSPARGVRREKKDSYAPPGLSRVAIHEPRPHGRGYNLSALRA
jgi:hypothetical protein